MYIEKNLFATNPFVCITYALSFTSSLKIAQNCTSVTMTEMYYQHLKQLADTSTSP